MRAVAYDRYGPPDVLRLVELPTPIPKPDELLIRVASVSVNRTDCGFLQGDPWLVRFFSGLLRPKQQVLGNEFSGVVEAIGPDVTAFKVGDQVTGLTGDRFGAHAEYVCVGESQAIVPKPSGLDLEQASASWDGPWLALTCLRRAQVGRGTDLLIYGASGSIGTSAVQLAKHFGANVVAVCNTKNVELVRSLGTDQVIDYTQTDFTRIGRAFDVVLDAVGKSTFAACKPLLKPKGLYVSTDLGPWWQNPWLELFTKLLGGRKAALAIPDEKRTPADIQLLAQLYEAKAIRPLVDRVYPLEQIVDAYRYVASEQKVGSVVIRVSP